MKFSVIITTADPETAFNALRLANHAAGVGDQVGVSLLGQAVEITQISTEKFDIARQIEKLLAAGGRVLACGTCLKLRGLPESETCPATTIHDLYELVSDSDRTVTF